MSKIENSKTFIAIPPGETIKEQLQDRGMSQKEFAVRMDMSEKHISKLVNGEVHLTQDMARRLEMVLGAPARFWNNLESIYREDLERVRAENDMEEDLEVARMFPYNEMAKNGWVENTRKPKERVVELRKFFEVVRLDLVMKAGVDQIACRKLSNTKKSDYAMAAWAQQARLEAREMEVAPINVEGLKKALPRIREMTVMDPQEFSPLLRELLAEYGIALVYLPHIRGSFLHGATFPEGKKIVIGMTVRGRDADKFWFSMFHELGHVVLKHVGKAGGTTEKEEDAANRFAAETLIPEKEFAQWIRTEPVSIGSIRNFAREQGIADGIVVGRLQGRGIIPYDHYNHLKKQYVIVSQQNEEGDTDEPQ